MWHDDGDGRRGPVLRSSAVEGCVLARTLLGLLICGPAHALTLTQAPLEAGGYVEITVTGATPMQPIYVYAGDAGVGAGPCPAELGGLCLDVAGNPDTIASGFADGAGVAILLGLIPVDRLGDDLTTQAGQGGGGVPLSATITETVASRSDLYGVWTAGAADARLLGQNSNDLAGAAVSGAGDVDGDGFDDILIGARRADPNLPDAGIAYIVHGPVLGDFDLANAGARLMGEQANDYAGSRVSDAGDVNGDGFADVLVGAFGEDTGGNMASASYLVLGPMSGDISLTDAEAKFIGEAAKDHAMYGLSDAGDVNDDGFDDILIGAKGNDEGGNWAGAAYIVLGPVSGDLDLAFADAKMVGANTGDQAGIRVSGLEDTDGDGFDDVLVGAHFNDTAAQNAGVGYVVNGPIRGHFSLDAADAVLIGEDLGDYVGLRSSGGGDVNGDGLSDAFIGGFETGPVVIQEQASTGYLVHGFMVGDIDLATADAKLMGVFATGLRGLDVSDAGDVNNDGFDDLLVGSKFEDTGGSNAGASYLVLGPVSGTVDLELEADVRIIGDLAGDYVGFDISGVGDTDGDGYDDFILGAYGEDTAAGSAGAGYLFLGAP